ncbi:hypothetical protein AB0D47_36330 [Streptomyces sp. NPDC048376]|uniref:hypothetical protein n=1 Tax=Streptomyces sp. NPDC048376 TaxID=3154926 RepID=UPI00342404DD
MSIPRHRPDIVAVDPELPEDVRQHLRYLDGRPRWAGQRPPEPPKGLLGRLFLFRGERLRHMVYRRYVGGDDLNETTWPLAQRAEAAKFSIINNPVLHSGLMPHAERLRSELASDLWMFASRAAEWSRMDNIRRQLGRPDHQGLLPTAAFEGSDQALEQERAALERLVDGFESQATQLRAVNDRYQAWLTLQELAGHQDDFRNLLAADAADDHLAEAWGAHFTTARELAQHLDRELQRTID